MESPHRHSGNAPGSFYTTGCCLACGTPEFEAPGLLADIEGENSETFFVRQPQTAAEVEAACRALEVCCVSDLRYRGKNLPIINRLGNSPEYCDFISDADGQLFPVISSEGELYPAFRAAIDRQPLAVLNRFSTVVAGRRFAWHLPYHGAGALLPATPARTESNQRGAKSVIAFIAAFSLFVAWLWWAAA